MGPSIGLISSCLPSTWIAFTLALTVTALRASFFGTLTDIGRQTGHLVYSLWRA